MGTLRARVGAKRAHPIIKRRGNRELLSKLAVDVLEQRMLLSTYTGTSFNLSGTGLTYSNPSPPPPTLSATVVNGDSLHGSSLTTLSISESNNISISNSNISFGSISLGYSNISFISDTNGGGQTLTVNGTGSAETFNVTNNLITVTGSAFPNGLQINYSGFSSVSINGGGGGDTLNVDGGSGAETFAITGSSVSFNGTIVNYSNVSSLVVNGGGGNDTFGVTADSVSTTINTNAGATTTVGNSGTLSAIAASLTVNGGTLTISDTNAGAQSGAMSTTAVTGLDMGASGSVNYSSLSNLNVNLSASDNGFTINNTPASPTTTVLSAGAGSDTVTMVSDSGPTTINTGSGILSIEATGAATTVTTSGTDTIFVGSSGTLAGISGGTLGITGSGSDTLSLNDTTDSSAHANAVVSSIAVTGLSPSQISYASVGSLSVALGTGGDTVAIQSTGVATSVTSAAGPTNNITVGNNHLLTGLNGALTVTGNANDHLTVDNSSSASGTGTLTAATLSGLSPTAIAYSSVATLQLNLGANGLTISSTASTTSTSVDVPSGPNTVNVTGINSPTSITSHGSGDTVNVGSTAPMLGGTVGGIGALLTVTGANGDSLVVDDSGFSSNVSPITIATGSVSLRSASPTVHYSGLTNVTAHLGSGSDVVNVTGTSAANTTITDAGGNDTYNVTGDATSSATTINTGNGNDIINVRSTGGTTNINTGTGTDSVVASNSGVLSGILGTVSVTGPAASTHTSLSVDDSGNSSSQTFTVAASALTWAAGAHTLNYSNLSSLQVTLGSGGNNVTVSGTSAPDTLTSGSGNNVITVTGTGSGKTTVLNTGTGNDAVNVQGMAGAVTVNTGAGSDTVTVASATNTLSGITAALSVSGQSTTALVVNDTGNAAAASGTLTSSAITGLDLGVGGSIGYSGVGSVTVGLGTAANIFTVANTLAASNTVNSHSGLDTISVQSTGGSTTTNVVDLASGSSGDHLNVGNAFHLNTIQGALSLQGKANDILTLSDTSDSSPASGSISSTLVTGFGTGGSGISYSGMSTLNVNLGTFAQTVTITGTNAATTTNFTSGNGNDQFNVQAISGPTTINTGGGTNTVNVGNGGLVSGIASGDLSITGGVHDTMTVDDSADMGSAIVNAGPPSVSIGAQTVVNTYSGFSTVTVLHGGTTLLAHPSINTLVLTAPIAVQTIVTADLTANTITIGATITAIPALDNNVTIAGQFFGGGYDPLIVKGTAGNDNITVTGSSVAFAGGKTINYSSFDSLWVYGGGGNDTFTSTLTGVLDSANFYNGSLLNFQAGTYTLGAGTGNFTINSGSVPVNVYGGSNSDTFTDNGNSAALTFNGGTGVSNFNVNGSSAVSVLNAGAGQNNFNIHSNSATLTVNGGGTSDNVNVTGNSSNLNVNGGTGIDTFTISNTTGPTTIQAGNGATTAVTVNGPLGAPVSVTGAASGAASLVYNGSTNAQTFTVTHNAIQDSLGPNSITYSQLAGLTINGNGGTPSSFGQTDLFYVAGDSTPTTLNGGPAPDQFYVNAFSSQLTINTGTAASLVDIGSADGANMPAPATGSVLSSVSGTVTVNGNGGDTLNLDDSGNSGVALATLSATGFTQGPATVAYSQIGTLNVLMASGGNTLTVSDSASGTTTNINTGAGNDNVYVQGTHGTTNINTGGGMNTLVVASTAPTPGGNLSGINAPLNFTDNATDSLTIDDSGNTSGRTATLNPASFAVAGLGAIGFSNVQSLSLNLGSGANNLMITGTNSTTTTAITNAGSASDTIILGADSGPTNITTSAGSSTVFVQATGADTTIAPAPGGTIAFYVGSTVSPGNLVAIPSNPVLSGSAATAPSNTDLTALGTTNWSHWGDLGTSTPVSMSGVTPINYTPIGSLAANTWPTVSDAFSWSNGAQIGSASGDASTIYSAGVGTGYQFVLPADTQQRTVNVFVGVDAGTGQLSASLSDGSAVPYTATLDNPTSTSVFDVYTINYAAASAGQTLTLRWVQTGSYASFGNIGLEALALSTSPPALVPATNPAGILDNIKGKLTVNGGGAGDLTLDDTGSTGPKTGQLTNTTVTGMGMGPNGIIYSGIATLNINLGTGADAFTINGTGASTTNLTSAATTNGDTIDVLGDSGTTNIATGGGNDTVNVQATAALGVTNIDTGAGTDVVNLGSTAANSPPAPGVLNNLHGAITVTGSGTLSLNADDTGTTSAKTDGMLTSTMLTGLGTAGVTYSHVATLNVALGSGGNAFVIASTSPTTTTNLNSGPGNDTIYVQTTSDPTNIDTGGGTNTVNVGSSDSTLISEPALGSVLDGIAGVLSITGHNSDTVNLDDAGSTANKTGQLTPTTETGLSVAPINYAGITTLNVNLGTGSDTFAIVNTGATTTNVTSFATTNGDTINVLNDSNTTNITTGGGNDTVNVKGTSGLTNINTGTGIDTVNLGSNAPGTLGVLDNLHGPITLTGDGSDTLNLDDTGSAAAKTGIVTNSTITGLGTAGITYQGVAALNIHLGTGGDTLAVQSTNATTVTSITTAGGINTIDVGSNDTPTVPAPAIGSVVAAIAGTLNITGDGLDIVNVDDVGNTTGNTGVLTSTSLTGLSPGAINYAALKTLNVNLGSGPDTFTIVSTNAATTTNLNSGPGNDTIYVQTTSDPTNIDTGGGTNTVNVGSSDSTLISEPALGSVLDGIAGVLSITGHNSDTVNLDDAGSTANKTGQLTPTTETGLSVAPINYAGITTLNVNLGTGSDTFAIVNTGATTTNVTSFATTNGDTINVLNDSNTTNITTGGGNDTVNVKGTSGLTNINTGTGIDTVNLGSNAPGTLGVLDNLHGPITLTGDGSDTLNLDDTGSAAAKTGIVTNSTITGLGTAGITYQGVAALNIHLGTGGDTLAVQSTNATTVTSITTAGGINTIDVGSNDTPTVPAPAIGSVVAAIAGTLNITGDGLDIVNVDDVGNTTGNTGVLTSTSLTGLSPGAINYAALKTLNVNLGSGPDTFTIVSTNAATTTNLNSGPGNDTVTIQSDSGPTNVNTGPGNDTVNVLGTSAATSIVTGGSGADTINIGSSAPVLTGGSLAGIQGVVTVTGDGSDTLNADDSGVSSPIMLNVSASVVSASNAANINYSGLSNLNINLGSGNNVITVTGTSATSNSAITAGNGNNTFTVLPSTNTPTPGLLTLGGPLTLSPGTGTNSLIVNDSADPLVRTVTVTGTTISGLGGPINYGNFLNLTILLGTASGNSVTVSNSAGPLPVNTTIQNGSTTGGTATVTYTGDFNGNLNLVNFANGSVVVTGNFNGNLTASALGSVTVGVAPGSATNPASGNFFGNLTVTGLLGAVAIYGGIDSGMITAGSIGTIYAPHLISDPGLVFQVTQAGVLRQIQAGAPTGTGGGGIFSYYGQLPNTVTFAILYDGASLSSAPQAAIRVTNNPGGTALPLDLALTSSSTSAKFDLSRVDATTTNSGIQSLSVEGDLLTTLTGPEKSFLYPSPSTVTTGGVFLPTDTLLDVAVRDNAALASVATNGIMAAAFASLGGTPYASLSSSTFRAGLFTINPSTGKTYSKTVYVNGRMRVPVGLGTVGLFMDNEPDGDADFDGAVATFTDQGSTGAPVTAFLTFVNTQPTKNAIAYLQVPNLNFVGDGGSISTSLPVLNVTSTGPLGDITLSSTIAVTNVTAPSVSGNVSITGGIAGTFQTTGIRIDPLSGVTSAVSADIGRTLTSGSTVTGVTTFKANIASTGKLVSRGNLISAVTAATSIAGAIGVQGNIGVGIVNGSTLTRFGGITTASLTSTGDIIALGNIFGDLSITGTDAGRIAAQGTAVIGLSATETGILGNVTIATFASTGAVISGGMIGDSTKGASIYITQSFSGFLAALNAINIKSGSKTSATRTFANQTGANATAISNIWQGVTSLDTGGPLVGLTQLVTETNKLKVSGTTLTGT